MRKKVIFVLCSLCAVLGFFTILSVNKVLNSEWELPSAVSSEQERKRIVLITQELDTPFWKLVGEGAASQAEREDVGFEIWGSYGKNQEDFLKQVEIALHSKVDGVIVQGNDTDEFQQLARIKAASYGIPIITVANDVPVEKSLRKTYVGSDHYAAGELLMEQLLDDMGDSGEIVLLGDGNLEYSERLRLNGMEESLKQYPEIRSIYIESGSSDEEAAAAAQSALNQHPNVDAFILLDIRQARVVMQEISSRTELEPFFLYSFDDGSDASELLTEGKLDAIIEQSPKEMGAKSVEMMMKWLRNEVVPLDSAGYVTDIRIVEGKDELP
ncbi:sugar ABC transporter substrate-binding protein [Planococcus maritimus]|uniref:sugar ABC transporter substrate-binding protein n=1 Tax=Planococcus maritimus TaxID=192421 RepID=UPI000796D52A|nr:substrate-binding domain-containing protein [Planococcus maritimus]KYG58546.1 sugar ABC transporter substrate-binding protein [Planococcus maritimus]OED31713.1 sugar ABC transporter substrate-binding protein [Planococcus maritimus]